MTAKIDSSIFFEIGSNRLQHCNSPLMDQGIRLLGQVAEGDVLCEAEER